MKNRPPAEQTMAAFNAYLILSSGELVSAQGTAPRALHVRVWRDGERLEPRGEVEGTGPLGEEGEPGWFELSTRSFVPDRSASRPQGPYVVGVMTHEGFRPSARGIRRPGE